MKGLLETHGMVVEAWIQEHEAAGHTVSMVRKQRKLVCQCPEKFKGHHQIGSRIT